MTHYHDKFGRTVDRSEAVDPATGCVRSGYSIAVSTTMADSATPAARRVLDTPSNTTDAEGAHGDYVSRMTTNRKPAADAKAPAEEPVTGHAGYLSRLKGA